MLNFVVNKIFSKLRYTIVKRQKQCLQLLFFLAAFGGDTAVAATAAEAGAPSVIGTSISDDTDMTRRRAGGGTGFFAFSPGAPVPEVVSTMTTVSVAD